MRVWVTAERRVDVQVRYMEERGAEVLTSPLIRTLDDTSGAECAAIAEQLIANPPAVLIAQTGQGLQWWTDRLEPTRRIEFLNAISDVSVWSRGAKATSRSRLLGLQVDWQSPNESATAIAARCRLLSPNTRVAVQLVGTVNDIVLDALHEVEAEVISLRVYRYALPTDHTRCFELISEVIAGRVDAITFTASPAIQNLRAIAEAVGLRDRLDHALSSHCLPVVVGPVCSTTAADAGWKGIVEPEKARLIPMLDALTTALVER